MIVLKWAQFPEADVVSYKIYRSIIGFKAPIVPLNTKTLQLKLNGGSTQTFTFNNIDTIIDTINNTITGGQAYLADSGTEFFVRSNIRESPGSVEIIGGTALADLGLTAHLITEQSENFLIATVVADPDPNATMAYDDPDGALQDFYALSTVDSLSNESLKTDFRQPITLTGDVCVIEGTITDLQGVRVPDAEVIATLQVPPGGLDSSRITITPVKTLSGPDGRFSLVVLQNALIRLEIPSIGIAHNITVPAQSFALLNDLVQDLDYRYPLGFQG